MIISNIVLILIAYVMSLFIIFYVSRVNPIIISEETYSEIKKNNINWNSVLHYSLILISIVLGMIATILFNNISEGKYVLEDFRVDFILSVIVSPIILRFTLKNNDSLRFESYLLAFQNGFFWEIIFHQI